MERGTFFLFALTLKDYLSLQLDTFFFQFISNSSSVVFLFIFYRNQRSKDCEVCKAIDDKKSAWSWIKCLVLLLLLLPVSAFWRSRTFLREGKWRQRKKVRWAQKMAPRPLRFIFYFWNLWKYASFTAVSISIAEYPSLTSAQSRRKKKV